MKSKLRKQISIIGEANESDELEEDMEKRNQLERIEEDKEKDKESDSLSSSISSGFGSNEDRKTKDHYKETTE